MNIYNLTKNLIIISAMIPAFTILNAYMPDSSLIARGGYRGGDMPHYGEDNQRSPGQANADAWSFEKGYEEAGSLMDWNGGTVYGVPAPAPYNSDASLPGNNDNGNSLYNSYPK